MKQEEGETVVAFLLHMYHLQQLKVPVRIAENVVTGKIQEMTQAGCLCFSAAASICVGLGPPANIYI